MKYIILKFCLILMASHFCNCYSQTTIYNNGGDYFLSDSLELLNQKIDKAKNGWWVRKNILGNYKYAIHYSMGIKDGHYFLFYLNGNLKEAGNYKNGLLHGGVGYYRRYQESWYKMETYENGVLIKSFTDDDPEYDPGGM